MGGTERFSRTLGSHYVCAVRTLLAVNQKHYSIRRKPYKCIATMLIDQQSYKLIILSILFIMKTKNLLHMYVYMYVHVYTYVHNVGYIYNYVCVYIYTTMYIRMYNYIYMYTHMYAL